MREQKLRNYRRDCRRRNEQRGDTYISLYECLLICVRIHANTYTCMYTYTHVYMLRRICPCTRVSKLKIKIKLIRKFFVQTYANFSTEK